MISACERPQATTPQQGRYVRRTCPGGRTPSFLATVSMDEKRSGASTRASTGPRSESGSLVSIENQMPPKVRTTSAHVKISSSSQPRSTGTIPPQASNMTEPATVTDQ